MDLYESVKKVAKEKGYSINRLEQELGFPRSYIGKFKKITPGTDKIQKIADFLGVSVEYLTTGTEKQPAPELTARNEKDIEKALQGTLEQLDSQDGLMFDGAALDPETRELLRLSLENTIRTAKITAKKKFTPKNIRANEDD